MQHLCLEDLSSAPQPPGLPNILFPLHGIWAGIHFQHELVAGKAIGLAGAQKVIEQAK